jgi:hypothetical protein
LKLVHQLLQWQFQQVQVEVCYNFASRGTLKVDFWQVSHHLEKHFAQEFKVLSQGQPQWMELEELMIDILPNFAFYWAVRATFMTRNFWLNNFIIFVKGWKKHWSQTCLLWFCDILFHWPTYICSTLGEVVENSTTKLIPISSSSSDLLAIINHMESWTKMNNILNILHIDPTAQRTGCNDNSHNSCRSQWLKHFRFVLFQSFRMIESNEILWIKINRMFL